MSLQLPAPLWLIGAGKMGCAMAAGWLEEGLDPDLIRVQDPNPSEDARALFAKYDIDISSGINDTVMGEPKPATVPSIVVLAVKPQIMDAVLPALKQHLGPDSLLLSIAAGRTIDSLVKFFEPETALVRSMPNTPSAIGRGMTVCVANATVTAAQKDMSTQLLSAVGEVAWVGDEELMDAVTAVSGSGPAYIFLLAEAMTAAGIDAGLDAALAKQLVRATISGAGELLRLSDLDASELRVNVTSPGGTTAAALDVLMAEGGMNELLNRAIAAATKRSKDLAS